MRPDTRSFSFTWMKGQSQKNPHEKLESTTSNQDKSLNPESSKRAQSSATGSSYVNPTEGSGSSTTGDGWIVQRGNSGSRLRKLSNSLVRLRAGRYSNLEDENKWQQISEEPLSLEEDEDDEVMMEVQEPDVVAGTITQLKMPMPFQPLDNNEDIERGESSTGESSGMSLSKRLNKTVQGVKASLGNFSQVLIIINELGIVCVLFLYGFVIRSDFESQPEDGTGCLHQLREVSQVLRQERYLVVLRQNCIVPSA